MDASLTKSGQMYALELERRLSHSQAKVWRVLTERELLNQWFPAHVIGEWKVGAKLRFEFQHGEGEGLSEEEMRGEVLTVEPERLLEFSWGTYILRCELVPDGDGCRFLFSSSLEDASTGARDAVGWEWCLQSLETVLRGAAPVAFAMDAWRERFDHYVGAFEPEFGPQQDAPENMTGSTEDGSTEAKS